MKIAKKRMIKMNNEKAAEWIDPKKLKKWDKNPRKNDLAIPEVMKSIEKFGFCAPIVAQKGTNRIIYGHTRIEAFVSGEKDRKLEVKAIELEQVKRGSGKVESWMKR